MNVRELVCTWLLHLLHVLTTLSAVCYRLWRQYKPTLPAPLTALIEPLRKHRRDQRAIDVATFSALLRRRRCGWRVPSHVALLVMEQPVCWRSLCRLVQWSVAAGIETLSIYDSSGCVRRECRGQLLPLLDACGGGDGLRVESLACSSKDAWRVLAGGDDSTALRLFVLDASDGVGHMARTARDLCKKVERHEIDAETIDVNSFGAALAWPVDEPQLAVCLGPVTALLGYPPWQLRLTEILTAVDTRPLPPHDFLRIMQRYSGIQQRFGV